MKLTKVIPKIFYTDIKHGLECFVDVLGFTISHQEANPPFYIVDRDGLTLFLFEDDEYAKKDRPEIRIVTDDINALYEELASKDIKLFHPNLSKVTLRPWGVWEFALADKGGVCVVLAQANR
ncbi:hypothetical protein ACFS5N_14940 [Mucilaginibacter ximonensis]|uniref:VOC domain-containing protein n=1 Tax=Mucilaginibacter ximonensis TaxID=538021 RepID=A0ABW5YEG2_9SPHI